MDPQVPYHLPIQALYALCRAYFVYKGCNRVCYTYKTSLGTTMSLLKYRLHPQLLLWNSWPHITCLYRLCMLYQSIQGLLEHTEPIQASDMMSGDPLEESRVQTILNQAHSNAPIKDFIGKIQVKQALLQPLQAKQALLHAMKSIQGLYRLVIWDSQEETLLCLYRAYRAYIGK